MDGSREVHGYQKGRRRSAHVLPYARLAIPDDGAYAKTYSPEFPGQTVFFLQGHWIGPITDRVWKQLA